MIEKGVLNIHKGEKIGLMVQSQCHYFSSIAFPDKIFGGLRVNRLGNSSVEYGVAIFKEGQDIASAQGCLTHVFVNRDTQLPSAISGDLRLTLESLLRS